MIDSTVLIILSLFCLIGGFWVGLHAAKAQRSAIMVLVTGFPGLVLAGVISFTDLLATGEIALLKPWAADCFALILILISMATGTIIGSAFTTGSSVFTRRLG